MTQWITKQTVEMLSWGIFSVCFSLIVINFKFEDFDRMTFILVLHKNRYTKWSENLTGYCTGLYPGVFFWMKQLEEFLVLDIGECGALINFIDSSLFTLCASLENVI